MSHGSKLKDYLARIGRDNPPAPDVAGLRQLQAAHRRHIPFENLDIPLGRGIPFDQDRIFEKMVTAKRGGFCFEQNQLFADMLTAAGFTNRLLLSRVVMGDLPAMPPRTHCLVLVSIEGEDWIADVGFGGTFTPPMRLADGEMAQSGDGAAHRLTCIGEEGELPGSWLLERRGPTLATDGRSSSDDAWEKQYSFDLAQVADADLALGCHWASTHETSRFTIVTVASICLPDGFISLVDQDLTVWRAGQDKQKSALDTPSDYRAALAGHFGIDIYLDEVAALPLFKD